MRLALLLAGAAAFVALYLCVGSTEWITPGRLAQELVRGDDGGATMENLILWRLRLPRCLAALLVGSLLGAVGAAFQALFRNPLAEPYVIGVSGGAAVGGTLALILGIEAVAFGLATPALAFAGGMAALGLVLMLGTRRGVVQIPTLLLAGVVVGAMLSSLVSVMLLAAGQDTGRVLRWLLGSTTPMSWSRIAVLLIVLVIGFALLWSHTRRLNAYAVSEEGAQQLGVDVANLKWSILVVGTAMAATAVGAVGIIPFLGLVAPHLARRIMGADLRRSLLAAAAAGAGLLVASDLIAQRAVPGVELPIGAVTAILGAPALVAVLRVKS